MKTKTLKLIIKKSFIYNFLNSLRQKIDDPLEKKNQKLTCYNC